MTVFDVQRFMETLFQRFPDVESLKFDYNGKWVLQLDRGAVSESPVRFNDLYAVTLYLENLPPLNE